MKRSVAMMACVLSGAMVLGSFSPVMAETGAKAVSATVTDSKSSDDKKDDAKADTADKKDDAKDTVLEDGTYSAEFDTDSGMFHVNEANDGKGTLTVKDGKMTIHVSLNSKKIVNLFVGKAEEVLPREYEKNGTYADVIVVDPPRKGCDAHLLDTILKMNPSRVVYVSCDSATLARDLRYLCDGGYKLEKVCPVDMFPNTVSIETVCCLSR